MFQQNVLLDELGLRKLYAKAFHDDKATITSTTKMVLDARLLNLANCKTILLDKKRGIVFTRNSTNILVKKFISWQNLHFVLASFIIQALYCDHSHRHIIPFVSGNQILLPTSGYVHSPTSWIVQANLIDYCCLGENKIGLQFSKHQGPEYTLLENIHQFDTTYRDALIIAEVQSRMIEQLLTDFPHKFITETHSKIREIFPQQLPQNMSFHQITESFIDKIIEDVLKYNSSLLNEKPSERYVLQVKKAVKEKQERLR